MPIYTCPECSAKLKKSTPVSPGKKLKCPECEAIFPVKETAAPKPVAPSPARSKWDDEEDGPANYQLVADVKDAASEKARQAAFDPLEERFEKSKRGPALELVVRPSNYLLLCGVLTCLVALGGAFEAIFPMIFKVQEVNNQKASLYTVPGESKVRYKQLSDEDVTQRFWRLGGFVVFFMWGTVVCAGASKMHEIEKYWLAMVGSIMVLLSPTIPIAIFLLMLGTENDTDMAYVGPAVLFFVFPGLPMAFWCITTLRKQAVIDGFNEEPAD